MEVIQKKVEVYSHGIDFVSIEVDIDVDDVIAEFGEEALLESIGEAKAREYFGIED